MIIGSSGSGRANALLNLISQEDNINKIYLYSKDLNQPKYEFLIKKRKDVEIKHYYLLYLLSIVFIEYSNAMDDVYENIDDYNPNRKRKRLIVFDNMIADIMTNKKVSSCLLDVEIKCATRIYYKVLFFFSKRCQIK